MDADQVAAAPGLGQCHRTYARAAVSPTPRNVQFRLSPLMGMCRGIRNAPCAAPVDESIHDS